MNYSPRNYENEPSGETIGTSSLLLCVEDFYRVLMAENLKDGKYTNVSTNHYSMTLPQAINNINLTIEHTVKNEQEKNTEISVQALFSRGDTKETNARHDRHLNFIDQLCQDRSYKHTYDSKLNRLGVIASNLDNIAFMFDMKEDDNTQQYNVHMVPVRDPYHTDVIKSECVSRECLDEMLTISKRYFEVMADEPNSIAGLMNLDGDFKNNIHPEYLRKDYPLFEHIAGLAQPKAALEEIIASYKYPDMIKKWGCERPQGVLLYGPAGTGKTMLANAVANEMKVELVQKSCIDIVSKWVGESSRNVKNIFDELKETKHATILFLDEFDGIVAGTGNDQVENSILATFKNELESLRDTHPHILIIAATNNEDQLDENLMRAGRFDVKIYIPKPDQTARAEIFASHIPVATSDDEFSPFEPNIDLISLGEVSDDMTGADIKEILRRIRLRHAMKEIREGISTPISQQDIIQEIEKYYHY